MCDHPAGGPAQSDEQKAIAESLKDSNKNNSTASIGNNTKTTQGYPAETGEQALDTMRAVGVPGGLENVGNTCYFASLVQMYFRLRPSFLEAVLAFRAPADHADTVKALAATTTAPVAAPSALTNDSATANTFGDTLVVQSDEWRCPTCTVLNKLYDLKCVCCAEPKPAAVPTVAPASTTGPPPLPQLKDSAGQTAPPLSYAAAAAAGAAAAGVGPVPQ